ncbi:hypothetical protein ACFR9U_19680 [Halorientalis brevis]|uniref:DUF8060 domain-containing protein n=1 Tax=Halorientalis brevis TaxID=1126241 RepID=A0ABD6CIR5_9EURY|nr:hypothetical protein [Halorientalis brevis]
MTDADSEPMANSDPDSTDDDQSQFPDPGDGGLVGEDATRYLYWGAFATLLLLALTATVRFYLSASNAIGIWVAPDFVPVFQAAFNLAVVLGCAVGLSVLVRRMAT